MKRYELMNKIDETRTKPPKREEGQKVTTVRYSQSVVVSGLEEVSVEVVDLDDGYDDKERGSQQAKEQLSNAELLQAQIPLPGNRRKKKRERNMAYVSALFRTTTSEKLRILVAISTANERILTARVAFP
jgi:hypothetical protein